MWTECRVPRVPINIKTLTSIDADCINVNKSAIVDDLNLIVNKHIPTCCNHADYPPKSERRSLSGTCLFLGYWLFTFTPSLYKNFNSF